MMFLTLSVAGGNRVRSLNGLGGHTRQVIQLQKSARGATPWQVLVRTLAKMSPAEAFHAGMSTGLRSGAHMSHKANPVERLHTPGMRETSANDPQLLSRDADRFQLNRRAFTSALASGLLTSLPYAGQAATSSMTTPAALITAYPPLEYLEPVFELKLSLDALAPVARDPQRFPALKQRLDKFFGGGPLSEKFYYIGLSTEYISKIQYADLDTFVRQDKQQREQAMEDALSALEGCKKALAAEVPDTALVASSAAAAQNFLERWLSLVPSVDVEKVSALFLATRKADANNDGKLDKAEMATLPDDQRAVWEKRVAYVGD